MTFTFRFALFLLLLISANLVSAQDSVVTKPIVDVVLLKDGSKLSGTIVKWELARGMELKLITGAIVNIPKEEIVKVYQDLPFSAQHSLAPEMYARGPRPYAFREEGVYQTFSGFISFSDPGGAGVHYSIGHRFNRLLGVGLGVGFESNDFWYTRNMVPIYAEARGFLLPQRITPYYALKLGYGIALSDPINGTLDAKGGVLFCPEFGVRFGGRTVSYYLGLEYKIQNATWRTTDWWNGGEFTDKVSYRRLELRTGLVF
ncbi:MAG: hypothetical protein IPN60_04010 [Saprospiraceae bacterium]|nr:hypothetical protein [Candidatus Opimibacter skivensis]MBL0007868.1 hypothetical protein [Candidatus Opimibacter skivensis]MBP6679599.1 hypothetical protein [Saprospiraceae bacterium]HQW02186.1 hypothetical protein [Saprospiraceae bacterium]